MAATSTGFVGAVGFQFLSEENARLARARFKESLIDPPERRSPVLLDSEKSDDPALFTATLWPPGPELLWLRQDSDPTDLRHTRPVTRHKLLVLRSPAAPRPEWMQGWQTERAEDRSWEERGLRLLSQPSTRCEDWSTLRQLLPSRGRPVHSANRPAWETARSRPVTPAMTDRPATSFPKINSEMTRYCDTMFVNDKNFWNR